MDVSRPRPLRLDKRVEKMDMELKQHFKEHRQFVVEALDGLESRIVKAMGGFEARMVEKLSEVDARLTKNLNQGLNGLEARLTAKLEKFEETTKHGFAVVDGRLQGLDRRISRIERIVRPRPKKKK